ncbi:Hcp family type VI secretion system effector [Blastopirellula marina]|uniref:Type VI secretion system tube protein Hcp n=1 Tax=Blastopirellula marina TaxID=124 RepID=A0A2S8GGW8_9BACT|nr:type VI secretion system tube protein Hcp [Blastopirellula marina]PQO40022.1 type VI secretion system tube protein Hcp [Blastopirellula marina]PQO43683.1 type VI secretion system tube protein Hcp [Blastopirellula marina]PTL45397.1 Hcp1 family type VI secretion system effector [Blastopirellula marina]
MAVDYFLKITDIDGESSDSTHTNEIELSEFSWSASQTGTFAQGSGGGAGKVRMNDFEFATRTCKASPKLMLACAKGDHISEVVLTCRKAGGGQQEFYKITMKEVLVAYYQTGSHSTSTTASTADGSGYDDGLPRDFVKLNFAKIECEYRPQKDDGSLDNPVKAGYDLKANKPV